MSDVAKSDVANKGNVKKCRDDVVTMSRITVNQLIN